jgi:hypothetical protein
MIVQVLITKRRRKSLAMERKMAKANANKKKNLLNLRKEELRIASQIIEM